MKNGKKDLALCLVLILALSVLAGCGKPDSYEALGKGEAGKPVAGVMIQFCSDTACLMGTTDETGSAVFDQPAGSYTIHVLKVPAGYAADDTEYAAPDQPGQVTIVLK